MRHVTLITTGGTIEKTYDEMTGELSNQRTVVRRMLKRLRLEDTSVSIIELLCKDSLHMTDYDRDAIVQALRACGADRPPPPPTPTLPAPSASVATGDTRGVVVLHGTDTLTVTGETILKHVPTPSIPVVLTGAMRPFEMARSDALQNLTEAIFATGVLDPGVYCVAHGRVLAFPKVRKDRDRGTFVRDDTSR